MENDNVKFKNSRLFKLYLKRFLNSEISKFLFVILIFTFLFLHFVNAQTAPQFFVSWQADSYSPSWYQGKIFPTQGNRIKAGFELTENGKIIDLSKNRVRWYVNDELVKNEDNGLGIKSFSFVVSDYAGEDIEVKIAVLPCDRACAGYNKGEILYKIIKIPVVSPEAVMDAPYKERQISTGENKFFAYPFFFSVKNLDKLSFSWLINGQEAKGGDKESDILNLNINPAVISGDAVNLRLTIKNLLKDLEFGSVEKKLIIK